MSENRDDSPNMPNSDVLADLQSPLQRWSVEATAYLTEHFEDETLPAWRESWQFDEQRGYHRITALTRALKPDVMNRLSQLPSYAALDEVVGRSAAVGPLLNKMVGTPFRQTLFTTRQLAEAFIPTAEDMMQSHHYDFQRRYEEIVSHLILREIRYQVTCPIQGVSFDEGEVILGKDLLIERMTTDEIVAAYSMGLLPAQFPMMPMIFSDDTSAFALKKTCRLPRVVRSAGSQPDADELNLISGVNATEELEHLLQCLALMTHERVSISGSMVQRVDSDFLETGSWVSALPRSTARHFSVGFTLPSDKCAELQHIWGLSHDDSLIQNKALALAFRRLAFANERVRPEDRLLDIFIAAEAFYLTDVGDNKERGELKFRLALRAAVWSEGILPGWSKRQIFDQMKRGYDARSAVAHGGEPRPKDLHVQGARVGLPEFVQAAEEIVRVGIYKAFRQLPDGGKRFSVPWDDLILPE